MNDNSVKVGEKIMARREKTLPPHLKQMVETSELKFKIPVELHQRLQKIREKCKQHNLEFELDDVLSKAAEKAIRQVEDYLDGVELKEKQEENERESPIGIAEKAAIG